MKRWHVKVNDPDMCRPHDLHVEADNETIARFVAAQRAILDDKYGALRTPSTGFYGGPAPRSDEDKAEQAKSLTLVAMVAEYAVVVWP